MDDQELAGLDQAATAVVRFRPGRRVSFGQLAADLREKRGQAVYVYPRKRGQRWVELVEARRVASLAQDLEDLLQDCRLRRAVKATG
ncbi:hypothetical protein [Streptomyces sp. NPDC018045]|uniref:hypothetical protein n=1 Tax=Streptomyces sp. NPDC018045 TaxID=3365037 RepID=UPI0037B7D59F